MKRILFLLALVGGFLAYRRYMEEQGGYEATANAEPFSSESLSDNGAPPAASADAMAEQEPPPSTPGKEPAENTKDTLEQPTWLEPADAADGDSD